MRVGGVIVLALATTAFGDIVSTPLNCSGIYDSNTTFREYDFDFGVTFSEISKVYIAWSGEITGGRAISYSDPCNPFPVDVGIIVGVIPGVRFVEVDGGKKTYPEPEPFDEISKFRLFLSSSWSDLLDGQGRIIVYYTEGKWAPEAGRNIEHGSVTLNDATLLIEGTVISEPAADVNFYSDNIIEDGDVYNIVRIFDTPPDHTTIDMFGGSINQLRTYDSSTVNVYGGEIPGGIESYNGSTVNIYGGEIRGTIESHNGSRVNIYGGSIICSSFGVRDSSSLNIYGGELLVIYPPILYEQGAVNIYGYGFEYEAGKLTGFISDGSRFIFRELFSAQYLLMNLIVVPEPVSAIIDINPNTLNLSSKARWIDCRIRLPEDCNAAGINTDSVLLEKRVKADSISFSQRQQRATVKFNRSALADILEPGEVEVLVTGYLVNGAYFEGMDMIRVIDNGRKNK